MKSSTVSLLAGITEARRKDLDQSRRIHAIPMKKTDQPLVSYLTRKEMQALLNAPDQRTKFGIRDRAMLHLAFAAGLRVSELISLRLDHLDGQTCSSIHVMGKGRRERVLPLWKDTTAALRAWLSVRPRNSCPELFPNTAGRAMTRSGFEYILAKHVATARSEPSIAQKTCVTTCTSSQLCSPYASGNAGRAQGLSLLGHASLQSTEIYLRADPTEKLEALTAVAPLGVKRGRFHVPDKLLATLKAVSGLKNYDE